MRCQPLAPFPKAELLGTVASAPVAAVDQDGEGEATGAESRMLTKEPCAALGTCGCLNPGPFSHAPFQVLKVPAHLIKSEAESEEALYRLGRQTTGRSLSP